MKISGKYIGVFVVLGFLAVTPLGCSDDDNGSSPVPPNIPTNRLYVMNMDNGILAPIVESASDTAQSQEYTLTLENVTEDILWYTDRPERKSGTESTQDYIDLWPKIYGQVSPNAALDGFLSGDELNDGLYLKLAAPLYDSNTNRLTFQVTLLASTMTDQHPVAPVVIYNIKLTVLDNTPEGETDNWSFIQASPDAIFEPTETDGQYKLYLNKVYPEFYQIQNAPGTGYAISTTASLVDNWPFYFSSFPPNASLSGYTDGGLQLVLLELDNPSYQDNIFSYDATVLTGDVEKYLSLKGATLLIDSPDVKPTSTLSVTNTTSSPVDVYVTFGANSCVKQEDIPGCEDAPYSECKFNLTASGTEDATKVIPPKACPMNLTFRFDSPEGCDTTKAEVNINYPAADDFWNISLVDGWNRNVKIDVVTNDGSTKTLGPTNGKTGNKDVFGVYPLNCDICVAIQSPNCPIEGATSGCKVDVNGEHKDQYHPKVPCQWNSPGQNQVTISILD